MAPSPKILPVRVTYPVDSMHKKELLTNLERMGLGKLFLIPWSMRNATLVKDLVDGSIPDGTANTVRGQRDKWTLQFVAKAYDVPMEGRSQYGPSMNTTRAYFEGERDVSTGWKLSQCKDRRISDLLGFLNPIFHPARSSRLMVGLTSTIIAAWNGEDSFNWAEMLRNVIIDCVDKLHNSKETSLAPYLAHLYRHGNCLHPAEQLEWNARVTGGVGVEICSAKSVVLLELEDGQVNDHQQLPSNCVQATPSIKTCGTSVLTSNSEVRCPASFVTGSSLEETGKRNQLIIDDITALLQCPVGEVVTKVDALRVRTLDLQITIERMSADNYFLQESLNYNSKIVGHLQSQLQRVVGERTAHSKKVEDLQRERQQVDGERDAHSRQVVHLQSELQQVVRERDAHLEKVEHIQTERQQVEGERDAHSKQVEHLQSERQQVEVERDAHSKQVEHLQSELLQVVRERDAHSKKLREVEANLRLCIGQFADLKKEKDRNELLHSTDVQKLSTIKRERANLESDVKLRDRQIDKLQSELAEQISLSQIRAQPQGQRLGLGSIEERCVSLREGPDGDGVRKGLQVDGNSKDKQTVTLARDLDVVRAELQKVRDAKKTDDEAYELERAVLEVNVQDLTTEVTNLRREKEHLESSLSRNAIGKMMKNGGVTRELSGDQHTTIAKGNVGTARNSSVASSSRACVPARKSLNTQQGQPVPPADKQAAPTGHAPQWEAEGYDIHSAEPYTGSSDSEEADMDEESRWGTTQTVDSSDSQYWDLKKVDERYIETPGRWRDKTGVDDRGLGYFVEPDPNLIKVRKRYEHQLSGLAWLEMRESGWRQPRGGLLSDPQGMGKTIMMIFLILMALADDEHKALENAGGTLIVCPAAVLWQWHAEIQDKTTEKGKLRVLVHHGEKRTLNARDLLAYDVVITSYGILTADKQRSAKSEKGKSAKSQPCGHGRKEANLPRGGVVATGPLHELKWWRCILDEAQNIKNKDALTTAAACSLIAKNRWLLSGTPIHNSTKDAYSLFKFLKHPLGEWETFKAIHSLQRDASGRERFYRIFRETFADIMLRRNKDCLNLKDKKESVIEVEWKTPEEAARYGDLERQRAELGLACWKDRARVKNGLFNVILKQRLLCNHPDLGSQQESKDCSSSKTTLKMDNILVCIDRFKSAEARGRLCEACKEPIVATDGLIAPGCVHFFCSGCAEQYGDEPQRCPAEKCRRRIELTKLYSWCDLKGCKSRLETALVDTDENPSSSTMVRGKWSSAKSSSTTVRGTRSSAKCSSTTVTEIRSSAKFDAMLKYLREKLGADDKAIVFSQWTSSLDLFEHVLSAAGIKWTRVDGTMLLKTRSENLEAFTTQGEVKVILLSLMAANAGLNITAANHVLFMDCWWNPFLEDQGVGRAWRIGQQKTVYVIRFVIKCRVEEKILEMQDDKQKVVHRCYYEDKLDNGEVDKLKRRFLDRMYFEDLADMSE